MSIHILSNNVTICSWKHLNTTMIVWAKVWLPILWSLSTIFPHVLLGLWPRDPRNWSRMRAMFKGIYPATSGLHVFHPHLLDLERHAPKVCIWCQEEQAAAASAAEENRKPKGLFRTIPFLPSHSSQISSMMRRNFFSFSWPKMTPWSLDLPPLAFFPLSVLTCIIFVNLLSSRSVLCLWRSLLCSSWSLLSSSPCPLFLGEAKNIGINLQERSNKTELVDVWNLWQRSL